MTSPNKETRLHEQKKEKPFQKTRGIGIGAKGRGQGVRGEWQRPQLKAVVLLSCLTPPGNPYLFVLSDFAWRLEWWLEMKEASSGTLGSSYPVRAASHLANDVTLA